jgi:imidazolonepropionase-like amidohydrolase
MEDVAVGRPGAAAPANVERLRRTVEAFDGPLCDAFLRRLARTGVHYVPTHVTREMEARAGDHAYRDDARRTYITAKRNAGWEKDLAETAAIPAEEAEALRRFFGHGLEITRRAHRVGVKIMAGTDASDTMIFPGFSLHDELALLARAGLSPMEVLRSATSVPAAYLRRSRSIGGISPGQEADLVLLRANPLADIANTRSIEAVINNGRLFDRAALDGLLAKAEMAAAASRD